MVKVFVHLAVQDFDAWKNAYEGDESVRKQYGCIGTQVFRHADGLNEVVMVQEWESVDHHKKFIAESNLRETMKQAGSVLKASHILS